MHDLPLITTIAAAFAAAWVLGLITQRIGLSPIVGYLLAGIVIGPKTPGFKGDVNLANQLAEVGVILLMFGVGLHFHLKDLLAVRRVAIPGAIAQSLVATLLTMLIFHFFGWPLKQGLMLGLGMSVASTVVLMRGLMDRDLLNSPHGHVAVGWLIVEDIFTVIVLVLAPVLAGEAPATQSAADAAIPAASQAAATTPWLAIPWALAKLGLMAVVVLWGGGRVMPWVLVKVAKLRSRELFTLTILVFSIAIAAATAAIFGSSMALGAFLAGMVVGQSPVSQQAASDALPMRDAFAVLFFVAVGMLFDPSFLLAEPWMVLAGLTIVLVAKPAIAILIVALLGYSVRTALTVAIGLAQIGEFSFILAQVARHHHLLPEEGYHVLVATAIISISLSPLKFRSIDSIERWIKSKPRLWKLLNGRAERHIAAENAESKAAIAAIEKPFAIIVGYGPVGRVVDALLRDTGMETVIIDQNMDTVQTLKSRDRNAIFGDASRPDILEEAGVAKAEHLVVTLPHSTNRVPLALAARQLNPNIEITMRARYLGEREDLEQAGVKTAVFEEGEAGVALAQHVLHRRGVEQSKIDSLLQALRKLWAIHR